MSNKIIANTSWTKFITKTQLYKSKPAHEWTAYQVLGYIISKTMIRIEPQKYVAGYYEDTRPTRNGQFRIVKQDIMPLFVNVGELKTYLDWCMTQAENRNHIITTASYFTQQAYINRWTGDCPPVINPFTFTLRRQNEKE